MTLDLIHRIHRPIVQYNTEQNKYCCITLTIKYEKTDPYVANNLNVDAILNKNNNNNNNNKICKDMFKKCKFVTIKIKYIISYSLILI